MFSTNLKGDLLVKFPFLRRSRRLGQVFRLIAAACQPGHESEITNGAFGKMELTTSSTVNFVRLKLHYAICKNTSVVYNVLKCRKADCYSWFVRQTETAEDWRWTDSSVRLWIMWQTQKRLDQNVICKIVIALKWLSILNNLKQKSTKNSFKKTVCLFK